MRDEVDIKLRLADARLESKEVSARFRDNYNVEDMQLLPIIQAEINMLEWVLD